MSEHHVAFSKLVPLCLHHIKQILWTRWGPSPGLHKMSQLAQLWGGAYDVVDEGRVTHLDTVHHWDVTGYWGLQYDGDGSHIGFRLILSYERKSYCTERV